MYLQGFERKQTKEFFDRIETNFVKLIKMGFTFKHLVDC